MKIKPHIAVVGGANIDLTAVPKDKYVPRDSCPGSILRSYGGVGRNIAHNLALLGCEVSLVTVFGDDDFALGLKKDCERIGIDIQASDTIPGRESSIYLSINDENGDMVSAISAMDITDCITPEYVSSHIEMLNTCDAVVVETNLPSETIAYILDNCKVPVFADTVSTAKSHRIFDILDGKRRIHTLKMNRIEALELTGADASKPEDFEDVAGRLHLNGIERMFITLGSQGFYYHDKNGGRLVPSEKVPVVNTCGAGDSFLSGAVFAFCKGLNTDKIIQCALRASAITVQCSEAVNPNINEKYLLYE
ncbi:MAG: MarR family transcriptional regulator [Bacteroidales bacterium]|nr:MarR family transcriptional regulator [Bacteroidales bacterium]